MELIQELSLDSAPQLLQSLNEALAAMNRYLVCFSSLKDDTSQWSNYGDNGKGACLVFDEKCLSSTGWDSFKCNYDEAQQRKYVASLLEQFQSLESDDKFVELAIDYWKNALSFKRANFQPESEIRFLLSCNSSIRANPLEDTDAITLRMKGQTILNESAHPDGMFDESLRPFVPFHFGCLLREIIIGPRFEATRSFYSALEAKPLIRVSMSQFDL